MPVTSLRFVIAAANDLLRAVEPAASGDAGAAELTMAYEQAAVAIGMAIDLRYSVEIALLDKATANRILALISHLGFATSAPELDAKDDQGQLEILKGLEEFREHLGGELTITLVPKLGEKVEVHEMDSAAVRKALSASKA